MAVCSTKIFFVLISWKHVKRKRYIRIICIEKLYDFLRGYQILDQFNGPITGLPYVMKYKYWINWSIGRGTKIYFYLKFKIKWENRIIYIYIYIYIYSRKYQNTRISMNDTLSKVILVVMKHYFPLIECIFIEALNFLQPS